LENNLRDQGFSQVQRKEIFPGSKEWKIFIEKIEGRDIERKIFLPPPIDMREFISQAQQCGKSWDACYSCSTLHYSDNLQMTKDIRSIVSILREGGGPWLFDQNDS